MSEEKRRVLEMLETGKITQEDALRLLEALGEKEGGTADTGTAPAGTEPGQDAGEQPASKESAEARPSQEPPPAATQMEDSFSRAMEEVRGDVEDAVREAGKALQDAAEEAVSVMSDVAKAVPNLTLWPETPMGEPLEEPAIPPVPDTAVENGASIPYTAEGVPYTYPGASAQISAIDIEWVSGPVELRPWDGDRINVTEYAKRPLNEGQRLDMSVQADGVLRIRWTREKAFWKNMFMVNKHLVVEVPKGLAQKLEKLNIKTVSGSVGILGISGEDFSLTSTSGAVSACDGAAEKLKLNSVSGSVKVERFSAEKLDLNTTSGRLSAEGFEAEKAKLNTVSGAVRAYGSAESLDINSVSGSLELLLGACPEDAKLKTVSGRITVGVPENQGFTAKYNSVSGGFRTDFPVTGNLGNKSGKAVYGSGETQFSLNTMSGGMEIHRI